ncbi:MAG: DMT family transporter [bacterium]
MALGKIKIPVHFFPLLATVFWGFSFIWSTLLLKYYQPVTIIFFRLILSSLFLFFILKFFWQKERIKRKDMPLLFISAVFNPFLYFLGENYGLKFSSPTIASVIIATIPVFTPLIAYMFVKEKLAFINFVGIGISFGGVITILIQRGSSFEINLPGILFLFGAVASALCYSVLLKKLITRYSALVLVAYQNFIGIFLFLPIFFFFEAGSFSVAHLNFTTISSFLLLSILASSLSYVFFAHSIKILGISKTNIYTNMIPVFTAFFSFFLSLESFTPQKIAGIILVIAGVYLSERTSRHR